MGAARTSAKVVHLGFVAFVVFVLIVVIVSAYGMNDAEDLQAAHHQKVAGGVLLLTWLIIAVPSAIAMVQNRLWGYRLCAAIDGIAAVAALATALHADYGRTFWYACSIVAIANSALLARTPRARTSGPPPQSSSGELTDVRD